MHFKSIFESIKESFPDGSEALELIMDNDIIIGRVPYFDKITLHFINPQYLKLKEELNPFCKKITYKNSKPFEKIIHGEVVEYYHHYLTLFCPQRDALKKLRQRFGQRKSGQPSITEIEITLDLLCSNLMDADIIREFFINHMVLKPFKDRVLRKVSTLYWRREKSDFNFVCYSDRLSKIAHRPCCHIEFRIKKGKIKKKSLDCFNRLVDFDFRSFFREHLYLVNFDPDIFVRKLEKALDGEYLESRENQPIDENDRRRFLIDQATQWKTFCQSYNKYYYLPAQHVWKDGARFRKGTFEIIPNTHFLPKISQTDSYYLEKVKIPVRIAFTSLSKVQKTFIVKDLYQRGIYKTAIAKCLGLNRKTVSNMIQASNPMQIKKPKSIDDNLDDLLRKLLIRRKGKNRNVYAIFKRLKAEGYNGSYSTLWRYISIC